MIAGVIALSPAEAERFTQDPRATGDVLYTTSNNWMEVNYTQLVANARHVLTLVKPGAIPLAMVKVCSPCLCFKSLYSPPAILIPYFVSCSPHSSSDVV
jgi:hypothetical protein